MNMMFLPEAANVLGGENDLRYLLLCVRLQTCFSSSLKPKKKKKNVAKEFADVLLSHV